MCFLLVECRAKIQSLVARGGMADPDAPNDPASVRYRAFTSLEEDEFWDQEQSMQISGQLDVRSAEAVMRTGDQSQTTMRAADPAALVKEQLQVLNAQLQPTAASSAADAQSSRSAGVLFFFVKQPL